MEDYLKEMHKENDKEKVEDEEDLKALLNTRLVEQGKEVIPKWKWTKLATIIDGFETWEFDVFKYWDILEDKTLLHFGVKLFQNKGLLDKFSIPEHSFTKFLDNIQGSFYDKTVYHTGKHTI